MTTTITRRAFVGSGAAALSALLMPGCSDTAGQQDAAQGSAIDYMALVNKTHELPEGWEDALEITRFTNSEDWDVEVEAKAYEAYLELKEDLEADDVYVDLDSAYRSVAEQQRIADEFTEKYGEEYVKLYVAKPGFSEHHTGLALDLFLIIDGEGVYLNEDMVLHPDIWEKIHAKLADHGFILRYLPQRKIFTGYSYEPWHIRYLDDPAVAHEIMDAGLTLEEYLGEVDEMVAGCEVDYGTSELYNESDIDSALETVLTEFGTWTGCVLKRIAYAGDEACGTDELAYVNSLREEGTDEFDQAIVLSSTFHSPTGQDAENTAWEADTDYEDWGWHLGRTGSDCAWQLLTWGWA